MLGCTQGDNLTSPLSLPLFATPKGEGGRITVTGTGSPTAVEGRVLPWGPEVPPPVQGEVLTLWGGGLAIRGTSTSILRRGTTYRDDLLIHDGLLNQAPTITTTQSNGRIKKKKKTLQWTEVPLEVEGRRKGNRKLRKHKESRMNKSKQGSKKTMNNDPKLNIHSIYKGDGVFNNWRTLKRCPKILHHNVPPLTHNCYSSTSRVTRLQ